MNAMRALQFDKFGPPDVLSVREVAVPVPKAGEVLVKVSAESINPSDVKKVEGRFGATLPRITGRDFAGTVVSSGPWSGEYLQTRIGYTVKKDMPQSEGSEL
jgi:NADPH:quinone reductase-like Zn-dependent oxidoreductase